jgi:hypothetical protein
VIRRLLLGLLCAGLLTGGEQPVLLPLPELLKLLDAQQEWLLLPLAEYDSLLAAGHDPTPRLAGADACITSATVTAQVVDGREIVMQASFVAINRGTHAALAELFATPPDRLGTVTLAGEPGVLAPGSPVRLLLPGPGRFTGTLRWSVPLHGDLQRRTGLLPLPLAGGLSLLLRGDGRGEALADGLARDGEGWQLVTAAQAVLPLVWLPGGGGDDAPVFGAVHALDVTVQDGPRPVRWAVRLDARRGTPPAVLQVALPQGFTCTRSLSGVSHLSDTATGIAITRSPTADAFVIEGLLADGAPIALPRVQDAAWQNGTVRLASDGLLACSPPPGWRPLGGQPGSAVRIFAVVAPDAGMPVEQLRPDTAMSYSTSTVVAVGTERAMLDQVLLVHAGGTRIFHLPLRLPSGWKPTALHGADCTIPAADDLEAGSLVDIAIPGGLPPGGDMTLMFTAEAPSVHLAMPALVPSARRASHRMLIAAAPGIELAINGLGWRQLVEAEGLPTGARAELRADGPAEAVEISATPRPAAVEIESVCWLLPLKEGTWCRCDLRLMVRDGELDRLELDLPMQRDADMRLIGPGLTLAGDGPFAITAPTPWRGERLLRIEGRLRSDQAERIPSIAARLPAAGRSVVMRRWAALQVPADRDLQLATSAVARSIDADELPAWSTAIPGAAVATAWRLADGDGGGWHTAERALAAVPTGFIDALDISSQVDSTGWRSRVACRIAAAGLAELDLGLPEGAVLEQAAIDAAPAAIRRAGDRLLLALPGRTLVEVVLRYAGTGSGQRLEPPRFAGLPVTRTTWTVAIDPTLHARAVSRPEDMPLTAEHPGSIRSWMGGWSEPSIAAREIGPIAQPQQLVADDPRALQPSKPPEPVRSEPAIALRGHVLNGSRVGVPSAAALELIPLERLRLWDVLGRILAVLTGALVCAISPRTRWLTATMALTAIPVAAALIDWQQPYGPLLAWCEWLPVTVLAGLLVQHLFIGRRAA